VGAKRLSEIYVHVICSTKGRAPLISDGSREAFGNLLIGLASELGVETVVVGGWRDHMHGEFLMPPTIAVADFVGKWKGQSSFRANRRNLFGRRFQWSRGYAAFSVSPTAVDRVADYIFRQDEIHRSRDLSAEMRRISQSLTLDSETTSNLLNLGLED
jgi:REP element-mobilizing transposase RayT